MESLPFADSGINYKSNLLLKSLRLLKNKDVLREQFLKRKWLLAHGPQTPGPVG